MLAGVWGEGNWYPWEGDKEIERESRRWQEDGEKGEILYKLYGRRRRKKSRWKGREISLSSSVFTHLSIPASNTLSFSSVKCLCACLPLYVSVYVCVCADLSRLLLPPASQHTETDAARPSPVTHTYTLTAMHSHRRRFAHAVRHTSRGTNEDKVKWHTNTQITVEHRDQSSCLLNWQDKIDYYTL